MTQVLQEAVADVDHATEQAQTRERASKLHPGGRLEEPPHERTWIAASAKRAQTQRRQAERPGYVEVISYAATISGDVPVRGRAYQRNGDRQLRSATRVAADENCTMVGRSAAEPTIDPGENADREGCRSAEIDECIHRATAHCGNVARTDEEGLTTKLTCSPPPASEVHTFHEDVRGQENRRLETNRRRVVPETAQYPGGICCPAPEPSDPAELSDVSQARRCT